VNAWWRLGILSWRRCTGCDVLYRLRPAASEQPVLPYRDPDEAALEAARTYLATVSQRFVEGDLASLGLRISSSARAELDAACAILDMAEGGDTLDPATTARPHDVIAMATIAMATHGRSGLALWALGSVTDRVLHSTSAPLLSCSQASRSQRWPVRGIRERAVWSPASNVPSV
jgi:nucleotide-binding universal stress UspA family protein